MSYSKMQRTAFVSQGDRYANAPYCKPSSTDCNYCGQRFVVTSAGMRALYYHLKIEHQLAVDEAYEATGAAIDDAIDYDMG